MTESDDDTPDNTHTQRVLAQYYLSTEGQLPPWLPPPPTLTSSSRGGHSNASSISGSSVYRAGSKPVSLQDIYDSAGPNQSGPTPSRSQELYGNEPSRTAISGDRIRNKLRPTNARPSPQPGSQGYQDAAGYDQRRSGYSGRTGLGGGDEYDPYNYQQQGGGGYQSRSRDQRQGQYGGGLPNRPRGYQ